MPTNTSKYANEELMVLLNQLLKLNTEVKELMHTNVVHHQVKVPSRREIISKGKTYTTLKPAVIRLMRKVEKRDKVDEDRKIRIMRVHPKLSKFLRLKERGLPTDVYPDTLVMSYFSDWVTREGRSDKKNVKLFGRDDPFVLLFKEELSQPGSGPDMKDDDGNVHKTSVLDSSGNVVNEFPRCKHMVIFKNLYSQKRQLQGDKYVQKREVVSGDEHTSLLPIMEKERDLLKNVLKEARKKYTASLDKYNTLLSKQEEAKSLGDNSARTSLLMAKRELDENTRKYTSLLTSNNLPHKIKV